MLERNVTIIIRGYDSINKGYPYLKNIFFFNILKGFPFYGLHTAPTMLLYKILP